MPHFTISPSLSKRCFYLQQFQKHLTFKDQFRADCTTTSLCVDETLLSFCLNSHYLLFDPLVIEIIIKTKMHHFSVKNKTNLQELVFLKMYTHVQYLSLNYIYFDVCSTATSVRREIMKSCFYCVMAVRKAATHTAINPRLPQYLRATGFVQLVLQRYISIPLVLIHRAINIIHRCAFCVTTDDSLIVSHIQFTVHLIDLNMIYVCRRLCSTRFCVFCLSGKWSFPSEQEATEPNRWRREEMQRGKTK